VLPLALAAKDCACPLGDTILKVTDFTPLLSVTVALKVALAVMVAPGAGMRLVTDGPATSLVASVIGREVRAGCGGVFVAKSWGWRWPWGSSEPSGLAR
jgi:hypothetical protein